MAGSERRSVFRRISDSDHMKAIIAMILMILFLEFATYALELVSRIEAKLSASSIGRGK